MLINKGCDVNVGVCSLPLHLACKLGHAQIVRLLLDHGARADLSRGLCYPVSHYLKPAGAGKPPKFLCRQVRVPALPLSYAIPNDRDEVVKVCGLGHFHPAYYNNYLWTIVFVFMEFSIFIM